VVLRGLTGAEGGGLSQLVLLKTSADPQPEREFVYSKNTLEGKLHYVCVYYCRTYYKAVRGGGKEESGGHVL